MLLDSLDLSMSLEDEVYRKRLKELQKDLAKAAVRVYERRRTAILVFEGKDAAGKGGAIRRLTGALPPELFRVIPIGAPSPREKRHHYLWRFWNRLPAPGRIAIFDRSWYGRVLVERVEGFAPEDAWRRAYREIADMERSWHEAGFAVAKFWLHIDQNEQLQRFEERAKSPLKQWKLTEEDLRNREKWPQYAAAVEEMIERTHRDHAPWHLVEANDKRFARIKVLDLALHALESLA